MTLTPPSSLGTTLTPPSAIGLGSNATTHPPHLLSSVPSTSPTPTSPAISSLSSVASSTSPTFPSTTTLSTPPSFSHSHLAKIEHLDLSQNLLTSALPTTLIDLPNLKYLNLIKKISPDQFLTLSYAFQKLEVLSLVYNLIKSTIPHFLGNISTLKMLNLSYNLFYPGWISAELGNLTNLEVLWLT